ncbi:galactoside 2-alpha-L-fucosyltransferase-like isoform X1 [Selaginella moellendorffii]|uniref:galactoside 2-alpha-L-fucosyltransferase-like isoform X1 n=1 Tax=Selaginella moellendorffii TaxID=88036 RepID=UPI000D1C5A87|nr:galactoside 2-alpha-L-fucosyltransferase-like isoform X1 [Selaginella moellendorffii]|eukprot:XP_024520697.1 galactoside 2-alpha-L-fucosyltransferase-like isoform X1 [Selaginella moellendorffii]
MVGNHHHQLRGIFCIEALEFGRRRRKTFQDRRMKSYSPSLLFFVLLFSAAALLLVWILDVNSDSAMMSRSRTLGSNFRISNNTTSYNGSDTCRSRNEYDVYSRRRSTSFEPSESLHRKILEYEALHGRCAPGPEQCANCSTCGYLVYVPASQGIGNKMVAIVAAFLYALLTDRTMLIARLENLDTLFCEPFPSSSWLLPSSWKHLELAPWDASKWIGSLAGSPNCSRGVDVSFPEVVVAYLDYNYRDQDKAFFCQDQQQALNSSARWIVLSSGQYFTPALYNVPAFRSKLEEWFPQQEAIFHLLVRYLLLPSDFVWDKAARYYDAYLNQAELLVGVQLRNHIWFSPPNLAEDTFDCLVQQGALANTTQERAPRSPVRKNSKKVAVLVVSLNSQYSETLKSKVLGYDLADGSSVSIHQPSVEGVQNTGNLDHDAQAVMEIYLLSMSDVLVTSPPSTFGYSAAGLAGMRPVQFVCDQNKSVVCSVRETMEPCYHVYPAQFALDNIEKCECGVGFRLV